MYVTPPQNSEYVVVIFFEIGYVWESIYDCKGDHDWYNYCVSSEEPCVRICSLREKCYGYAFALKPSIESMNNGKNIFSSRKAIREGIKTKNNIRLKPFLQDHIVLI